MHGVPRIDGSGFLIKKKYIPGRERRPGSKKVFHDGERSTYIPLRASKRGITSCPSAEDALFTIGNGSFPIVNSASSAQGQLVIPFLEARRGM